MTPQQLLQLAVTHHQAGRLDEAKRLYRQVLADDPRQSDALHLLGVLAAAAGQHDTANDLFSRAVALAPGVAQYRMSLINSLLDAGRLNDAIEQCRSAVELSEVEAPPHFHADLGRLLLHGGQSRLAVDALERAARADPSDVDSVIMLAHAYADCGQRARALEAFEAATRIDPANASARNDFGAALHDVGVLEMAEDQVRHAVALAPQVSDIHNNLGNVLKDQGRPEDAIAAFSEALRLRPQNAAAHSNLLFALHLSPAQTPEAIAKEHRAWASTHADPMTPAAASAKPRPSSGRLRIGYVSPDFRDHPVGRLLIPLLTNHDHDSFEIVCYSSHAGAADPVTQRLRTDADQWREVAGVNDEQLARMIGEDRIDVLVDLTGHSAGNRLLAFARKPAPVQITWLGYPNTTGIAAMDWRMTDAHADPVGATENWHSERLLRLPRTAWCFGPPDNAPPPSRDFPGVITFGSFNSLWKLNDELLQLWAKVLEQVPNSRMLLKARGLDGPRVQQRVMAAFNSAGVTADRIELRPPVSSAAEHLATYRHVDIALDAYPYHGTMTTCEALWMGVGIVTLAGATHVSRVGVSLLTNAGLLDLIARTPEQFVSIAAAVAKDSQRRADLRATLRDRLLTSPLLDGAQFARDVESAYRMACELSPL